MAHINDIPVEIMLNIYKYVGPRLLYINNTDLLYNIQRIKDMYRKNPIKIHYRIKKITTNTKDTYYNPTYEYSGVGLYNIYENK